MRQVVASTLRVAVRIAASTVAVWLLLCGCAHAQITVAEIAPVSPALTGPDFQNNGGCTLRATGEAIGDPAWVCRFKTYLFEGIDQTPDGIKYPSWRFSIAANGNVNIGHRSLMPARYNPKNRLEIDAPAGGVFIGNTEEGVAVPTVPAQGLRVDGPAQVGALEFTTPIPANATDGHIVWIPIRVKLADGQVVTTWLYTVR